MQKKQMSNLVKFTQLAALTAIILVMTFTKYGYIPLIPGVPEINLVLLPVIVGAIVLGCGAGTFLGLVCGITSFVTCFTGSPMGEILVAINPVLTFIVCVPTRVLAGFLCGLVFKGVSGALNGKKSVGISYPIAAISCPIFNTLFFMSTLVLFFGKTDYIQGMLNQSGAANMFMFVLIFIGFNGLLEIALGLVVGSTVSKALTVANKKMRI